MSHTIKLGRAAYYNLFVDTYEAAGAPVERWMEASGLPLSMRDDPDCYIASLPFLNFVLMAETKIGLPDISGDAMRALRLETFSQSTQRAVTAAPTLHDALRAFIKRSRYENNEQNYWMDLAQSGVARVCSDASLAKNAYHPNFLQNWGILEVVRSFVGRHWTPSLQAFQSDLPPGENFFDELGNTNFLAGQPISFIEIPKNLLLTPNPMKRVTMDIQADGSLPEAPEALPQALRAFLKPILLDGHMTKLRDAADALAMSTRSLQRALTENGTSFRTLLNAARADVARDLLSDNEIRITDVAMSLGFSDSAHFSRAFRATTGLSPSEFRLACREMPAQ
ncbi:MAG: helix-turn-helix transcriptional regulator [Pseudomonadota bacterium]